MSFLGRVHRAEAVLRGFGSLGAVGGELDRQGDVIGVGLDDGAQALRIEELVLPFLQMQRDGGPALGALGVCHGELPGAIRAPTPGVRVAGLAARHHNLVGDDEGRIKADAELPDQAQILGRIVG